MRRVISTKYYTYRYDFWIILLQPNHYFWRQIHTTLLKYLYIKWDVVQYLNISNHIEYEIWVSNEIMEGRTSFIHSLYVRNSIGMNTYKIRTISSTPSLIHLLSHLPQDDLQTLYRMYYLRRRRRLAEWNEDKRRLPATWLAQRLKNEQNCTFSDANSVLKGRKIAKDT